MRSVTIIIIFSTLCEFIFIIHNCKEHLYGLIWEYSLKFSSLLFGEVNI